MGTLQAKLFRIGFMMLPLVLLIGVIALAGSRVEGQVQATPAPKDDIRQHLVSLKARTLSEWSFMIGFTFRDPVSGAENFWTVPYVNIATNTNRWLGEIGDDYVCFDETVGAATLTRCTPFSNIVTIAYMGGQ